MRTFFLTFTILLITSSAFARDRIDIPFPNLDATKIRGVDQLLTPNITGIGFYKESETDPWMMDIHYENQRPNQTIIDKLKNDINGLVIQPTRSEAAREFLKTTPRNESTIVDLRDRVAKLEEYLFGEDAV